MGGTSGWGKKEKYRLSKPKIEGSEGAAQNISHKEEEEEL